MPVEKGSITATYNAAKVGAFNNWSYAKFSQKDFKR